MITHLSKEDFVNKLKSANFNSLSDELKEYKKKVLTINESGDTRNLFLYFPSKERISNAKKELVTLYQVMQNLILHIVRNEPELLKKIGKDGIDFEALRQKDPNSLLGYARVDTIFGTGNFRVVEFNSRRPQMYEDADFYGKYITELIGRENLVQEENGTHLMRSVETQFQANIKKRIPETIVVINNFPNQKYSFSSINRIKEHFSNSKVIVLKCEDLPEFYATCHYENKSLWYKQDQIDLILIQSVCGKNSLYMKNGKIKNKAILEAYHDNAVELYTSPSGQISGTKLSLDLLQDKSIQAKMNLTDEEIRCINLIPHSVHANKVESINDYKKDDFVFKLTGLGQGQGVRMGASMSDEEWVDTFEKFKASSKDFLIQERINLDEEEIFDLQTREFRKAFITLEPFIINDLSNSDDPYISGYAIRAIPIEKYKSGMKFNPAYNNPDIYFGAVVEQI